MNFEKEKKKEDIDVRVSVVDGTVRNAHWLEMLSSGCILGGDNTWELDVEMRNGWVMRIACAGMR